MAGIVCMVSGCSGTDTVVGMNHVIMDSIIIGRELLT